MNYLIYDLDGTLVTSSRQITNDMINTLKSLKDSGYKNVIVSGGTYEKIKWQLCDHIELFDMIFSESGALLHINDKLIYKKSITNNINPVLLNNIFDTFIDLCDNIEMEYVGKRIDIRNGLIYLTPVGMAADDTLRNIFINYETCHSFRNTLINILKELDKSDELDIVKGGKTGVSITPKGIDKTQILNYIPMIDDKIYFFGDNCQEDGNDRCLYEHPRCNGYEVKDYNHTINLLVSLFLN